MNVRTKKILINVSAFGVIILLLIGPIRHIVANHPYEYVYFNKLAGGMEGAFGNYELDYYYHSTREASEWVLANAEPKSDGSKIRVGTWHTASVNYFFRNDTARFQPTFIRWYEKENSDWDYAIFTITGIDPEYLKSNYFPPKNTVKVIKVDDKPICIILKRDDKSDYYGFKYKSEGKLDSAILMYKRALKKDPDNMGALLNLGEIYLMIGQTDNGMICLDHYLKMDPYAEVANYLKAYGYYANKENDKALDVLHKVEKSNPKYTGAYNLAIQIEMEQKDFVATKKEFQKAIDYDMVDNMLTEKWIQCCAAQGIDENTAYRLLYKSMVKSLEKRGKIKEAEELKGQLGL